MSDHNEKVNDNVCIDITTNGGTSIIIKVISTNNVNISTPVSDIEKEKAKEEEEKVKAEEEKAKAEEEKAKAEEERVKAEEEKAEDPNKWYTVSVYEPNKTNIVFSAQMNVDPSNNILGVYQTINGITDVTKNIIMPAGQIGTYQAYPNAFNDNTYIYPSTTFTNGGVGIYTTNLHIFGRDISSITLHHSVRSMSFMMETMIEDIAFYIADKGGCMATNKYSYTIVPILP